MRFLTSFRDSAHVCVHALNVINALEDRQTWQWKGVVVWCNASRSDEEVFALIAVWGVSLLRTKPTQSHRPHSLPLHYEAEKK